MVLLKNSKGQRYFKQILDPLGKKGPLVIVPQKNVEFPIF